MDLKGMTALVTGASSGIGEAMARQLAGRGADVILVARRRERLDALATSLRDQHGVRVDVVAVDLGVPGAVEELFARTEGEGRQVDVLVNNAGSGVHERFADIAWEQTASRLQLNVVALTELTHRFVRAMLGSPARLGPQRGVGRCVHARSGVRDLRRRQGLRP